MAIPTRVKFCGNGIVSCLKKNPIFLGGKIWAGRKVKYIGVTITYIGFAEKDHIIAINRANLKECDNSAKIVSKSLVL